MIRKYGDGPIGKYSNGGGHFEDFHFTRYWRQDPTEQVPPIAPIILPKFDPVPRYQRTGAGPGPLPPRADIVLPSDAPGDIFDVRGLLERFDAGPPLKEDLYVEIKVALPQTIAAHAGWEQVRAWCMRHFALEQRLACALVLHRPGLGGSDRPTHVHVFIPARRLTVDGFVGNAYPLCTDEGNRLAWASWSTFRLPA